MTVRGIIGAFLVCVPVFAQVPLTLSSPQVPNGAIGTPYATVTWTVSNGTIPYTWTTAGDLPPGLRLSVPPPVGNEPGTTAATLSGTPSQQGTFSFAIVVTDHRQATARRNYTVTIAATAPLTLSSPEVPGGEVGLPYNVVTWTATNGTAPFNWTTTGNLPPGLVLRPSGLTPFGGAGRSATLEGIPSQAGTYTFGVTATDYNGATASRGPYTVTIAPARPTTVQLSRTRVDFGDVPLGGEPPDPQWVNVTSAEGPVRFTTDPDAVPWLTVTPARATAPARITIRVDQAGLGVGPQTANIRVSGSTSPIQVTMNVRDVPPALDVSPTFIRAQGRFALRETIGRVLYIRNTGGGGPQPYGIEVVGRSAWIRLLNPNGTPATGGQATVRMPDVIGVALDVQTLPRGVHRDVVRVTSAAGNRDIPVTILVSTDAPILGLNPDGVQFESRQGSGTAVARSLQVQNRGSGSLNWTAQIVNGQEWLSLGATQGTATGDTPGALPISVNPERLTARRYYGLVRVTAPGALNSPQLFPIALNVLPPTAAPQAAPSPSGLFFVGVSGGARPPSQLVRVFTSTDQPVGFVAGTATEDSSGWLSVANSTGTVATARPGEVPVLVDPANLQPGVYKGEVGVTLPDNSVRTVNITFIVTPPPAGARATAVGGPRRLEGCTPRQTVATHTGLISNFSTAVGWPTPLTVRVGDDCAEPVNNANVVVNFSNGDPPIALTLTNTQQGLYTGTWTPGRVTEQISITARVTAPNLESSTASINGASRESEAPVIAVNGLLNNLFPQLGGAMAPGTVAALYGADLAKTTQLPTSVPLPTSFQDTAVLIGGREAPIFSISPGQVNIQIPTELEPDNSYQVIASVAGAVSVPERILLTPVQPGVAAFPDGRVIAQHLDFTLVNADKPAAPGETVVLYLVGMGATNPNVATGQPAPLAPVNAPPTVTVDGRPATIQYAGLTPGGIGLYQINVQLPPDIPDGEMQLKVTQAGAEANPVMVPVRRQ